MYSPFSPSFSFPGLLFSPLSITQPLLDTDVMQTELSFAESHLVLWKLLFQSSGNRAFFLVHVALSNQALSLYSITQSTVMCFQATCSFLNTLISFVTSEKFPPSWFDSWQCSAQLQPTFPPLQGSPSNFHSRVLLWTYQGSYTPSLPSLPLRIQWSLSCDKLIFPPKSHHTSSLSLSSRFVTPWHCPLSYSQRSSARVKFLLLFFWFDNSLVFVALSKAVSYSSLERNWHGVEPTAGKQEALL